MPIDPTKFIKNSLNVKINPATQGTLSTVDSDLGNIQTNFTNIETNTNRIPAQGRTSSVYSDPIAIASNQGTLPVAGSMTFATPSNALIANDDQSLFYLRKIVKQLESMNTVDSARRKRIVVDGSTDMDFVTSGAVTTVVSYGLQKYQDIARNEYANGIRKKLSFS